MQTSLRRNPSTSSTDGLRVVRRRAAANAVLGVTGLGAAMVLAYPKVISLATLGVGALGLGAVANLALAFGSLMFLREAQRLRQEVARPREEP